MINTSLCSLLLYPQQLKISEGRSFTSDEITVLKLLLKVTRDMAEAGKNLRCLVE